MPSSMFSDDDLRAEYLLASDVDGRVVRAVLDQAGELFRARDVRALPHVHEQRAGPDRERLESRESRPPLACPHGAARGRSRLRRSRGCGQAWCRSNRPHDVHEPCIHELGGDTGHVIGRVVVAAELVRQAGVRIAAGSGPGDARELLEERSQLIDAEGALVLTRADPSGGQGPAARRARPSCRTPRRLDPRACVRSGR